MGTPRTAIVTGASAGVGRASALALAELGIEVALVARRRERLEQTVRQIVDRGGRAVAVSADLQHAAQAERAMREAQQALGTVDALVSCLGTNVPRRQLASLSIADWDSIIATNLSAVFYCVRAVLPMMRRQGRGMIISISSLAGLRPSVLSGAAYSASKAGLNALSACINLEEGGNGIQSCVVSPGDINTELLDKRPNPPAREARPRMLQPNDVAALVATAIRQPPNAWVEEIVVRPREVGTG